MVKEFYKDQKLHLLEDPQIQFTVHKVEDNAVVMIRWVNDYFHKLERYTDIEGTKQVLGEGWLELN